MSEKYEVTARIDPALARSLNDLANAVEDGNKRTVQEIHRLAEVSAKIELAKQRAELKALGPQIREQGRQIDVQRQRTGGAITGVKDKFDRAAKDLWDSYIRDIRRLGSHIFEILEGEYKRGIEGRVVAANFDIFTGITKDLYEKSNQNLAGWMARTREAVGAFVGKRQEFKTIVADRKLEL